MNRIGRALLIIMTLNLALRVWTVEAAVPPEFFSTPIGKDIDRGNKAGDECGSATVLKAAAVYAAAYDSCVTAEQDKSHPKGGNLSAFDAGLFFSVWQQMDGLARPDWPPKGDDEKKLMDDSKTLAVKYLKLFREAQNKAGLTDEQVIAVAGLNMDMFKDRLAAAAHGY